MYTIGKQQRWKDVYREARGKQHNLRAVYVEHTLSSKQIRNNPHTNESIITVLNWSISLKMELWKCLELQGLKRKY